jgi:dihydroorotate dehydrogenase (NAD+) catalytic subunit
MNAAGVLGFAAEYRGLIDFAALGAFVTNPLTFSARTPARPPNAVPLPDGVLIHTGLPNPGVRAALRRYARDWARMGCPVIVHLAATSVTDVRRSLELLEREDHVSGLELGVRDDVAVDEFAALIRAANGAQPVIVRLPAQRADELCSAAVQAGADALTVGAAVRATSPPVPFSTSRILRRGEGGAHDLRITGRIYGPDQFSAALEAMRTVMAQNPDVPVIGAGGIFSIENARAMLEAGAVAVQIDAALWRNPSLVGQMIAALSP